jgi:hypothetical protein
VKWFYNLLAVILFVPAASAEFFDDGMTEARITIRVMDEEGKPVARADTGFGFNKPKYAGGLEYIDKSGIADTNGCFTATGRTTAHITFASLKDGYYRSAGDFTFKNEVGGRWQPWDVVVTQVLRRVVDPIAMYAKHVEVDLPSADQPVGYDLLVGDWIAPYGKGTHGDLVFKVTTRRVNSFTDFDGSLLLTFSNGKDGLRRKEGGSFGGSRFPWSYKAPEEDYDNSRQISVGFLPGKGYYETNDNTACYLRVRAETNEQGAIVSSYYGKIPGPIKVDVRDTRTAWLKFTYYLNPTPNDRNMEFDPKRNLFKNLKSTEEVTAP